MVSFQCSDQGIPKRKSICAVYLIQVIGNLEMVSERDVGGRRPV